MLPSEPTCLLGQYMRTFPDAGLTMVHFDEPVPTGGDPERAARYRRLPWLQVMAWAKPEGRIA